MVAHSASAIDRQKVLKPKTVGPKAPVPEPVGMTMKDTNVHVLFLQQELFSLTCNKPLGLVQRFLFSFGARLNLGKQAWNRLLDAVTIPIIENLFASLVRRYGPHTTTTADPFCQTTAAQLKLADLFCDGYPCNSRLSA